MIYLNRIDVGGQISNWTFHVVNICHRCKKIGQVDIFLILGSLICHHHKTSCAHTVSDVEYFGFSSHLQNLVNHGGDIIFAHFIPTDVTIDKRKIMKMNIDMFEFDNMCST